MRWSSRVPPMATVAHSRKREMCSGIIQEFSSPRTRQAPPSGSTSRTRLVKWIGPCNKDEVSVSGGSGTDQGLHPLATSSVGRHDHTKLTYLFNDPNVRPGDEYGTLNLADRGLMRADCVCRSRFHAREAFSIVET